ncbi:MAG: cupin domain-containing protein [Candidatus Binatus sp.]|jgi:anti-sigma factor ChrR (cupin superfamily)
MKPLHSIDEARDGAALYVVGALSGEEAREFEAHLKQGCEVCAAEVKAFSRVTDELAGAVSPQAPSAELRERVLNKIASEVRAGHSATIDKNGMRFMLSNLMPWEETATKGIETKVLFRDAAHGMVTVLVRMAPGTSSRHHRHAAVEESYVLEGDVTISGVEMKAGDYCRAEPGSVHTGISTRGGCQFITIASERNESFY